MRTQPHNHCVQATPGCALRLILAHVAGAPDAERWTTPRMMRFIFCILSAVVVQTVCHADVTRLSAERQKALLEADRVREINTTTNLPPAVYALCADDRGRLANPGKQWEATDVIKDDKLPRKRLIWAVLDGDYYVVHYERGGRAHSFHVLIAQIEDGGTKPTFIWRGIARKQIEDLKEFLDAVARNRLDDRSDYVH